MIATGRQRTGSGCVAVTVAVTVAMVVGVIATFSAIVVGSASLRGANEPSTGSIVLATVVVAVGYEPTRRRLRTAVEHSAGVDETNAAADRLIDAIARYDDPERSLRDAAEVTRAGLRARSVTVWLEVDGTFLLAAADPLADVPARHGGHVADLPGDTVVMIHDGPTVMGALAVDVDRELRASEHKLLDDVASATALVVRTAALRRSIRHRLEFARRQHDDLAALRSETERQQLEERRRLERELHDTCQQRATVVAGKLGLIAAHDDRSEADRLVAELVGDVDLLAASVDRVAEGGSPLTLVGGGLTGALFAEAAEVSVPTEIVDLTTERFPNEIEEHVYACCLEAIRNSVAHGSPSRIVVRLDEHAGRLHYEVDDDGCGFDPEDDVVGRGLFNMRSRVEGLGGRFDIQTGRHGTRVTGQIPCRDQGPPDDGGHPMAEVDA